MQVVFYTVIKISLIYITSYQNLKYYKYQQQIGYFC